MLELSTLEKAVTLPKLATFLELVTLLVQGGSHSNLQSGHTLGSRPNPGEALS